MKKLLSVILVIAMIVSAGVYSFAESLEDSGIWAWDIIEWNGGRAGSYPELGAVLFEKDGKVSVLVKGLDTPTGLASDTAGNLYISETGKNRICMLDSSSKLTVYSKDILEPTGICWYGDNLYAAETGKNAVIKIINGYRSVVAGKSVYLSTDEYEGGFADGPCTSALFDHPQGIAINEDGEIFVSDTNNMAVRKISGGKVSTVFTNEGQNSDLVKPCAVHVKDSILYVNDMFMEKTFVLNTAKIVFDDVPVDAWFIASLNKAVNMDIIHGIDETHFAPSEKLTRAQLCQIILNMYRVKNPGAVAEKKELYDVSEEDWFFECVSFAENAGIIDVTDNNAFPGRDATRAEFVSFLYNYLKFMGKSAGSKGDLSSFIDCEGLEGTAKAIASWAVGEGLLNGYPDKSLGLERNITRAEAVTLAVRFADRFMK